MRVKEMVDMAGRMFGFCGAVLATKRPLPVKHRYAYKFYAFLVTLQLQVLKTTHFTNESNFDI